MKFEIDDDVHHAVGPYTDVYDHGPVTVIERWHDKNGEYSIAVCLDCGYTSSDIRRFAHEECHREDNPINQTWRERLEEKGFPDDEA